MKKVLQRLLCQGLDGNRPYRLSQAIACVVIFAGVSSTGLAGTFSPGQTTFAPTSVGQPSQPISVDIIAQTAGEADAPKALTSGTEGLDFSISDAGSCTGSLSSGQTCTVQVVFNPLYPGLRRGAVVLTSGNHVLGSARISGLGLGGLPVLMPGQITRIAGVPKQWLYRGDGGSASSAPVYLPMGLAVDGSSNLYLSDTGTNNRVRRVDASTGLISTVAGDGMSGTGGDGGSATKAQLNSPSGLALDGAGNLYIADSGNNTIRRVDAVTGMITTVAGTPGVPGYTGDGGPAMNARLSMPEGLAFTPSGDLVIADTGNNAVRVLTMADGSIQTVAGTGSAGYGGDGGQGTSAQLNGPWGVAVHSDGTIAIADLNNNCVRLLSTLGKISTAAGNATLGFAGDGGDATQAELNGPAAVAFDPAGDLIIADSGNNRIRGVYGTAPGTIMTIAGTSSTGSPDADGDGGPANQANLYGPYALVFDPQGNIWISDMFHNAVREINGSLLTINYPAMKVGKKSSPTAEALYNGGNRGLALQQPPVLNEAALDAVSTTCGQAPLVSGEFCSMGLELTPTETGKDVTGTVKWTSDAPNVTPLDRLQGEVLSVEPTTIALSATPNPGLVGQPVVLTATVASADTGRTGTVDFSEGEQMWCKDIVLAPDGKATCSIQSLSLGDHTFKADFSGDNNNAASESTPFVLHVKQQPTVVLSASSNPSVVTNNLVFTLTAASSVGTPTGAAVLYDGTTALATITLDSSGHAAWSTPNLGVGTHALSAQYAGDGSNIAQTSNILSEEITRATTVTVLQSSSADPTIGSTVTLTAKVLSTSGPAPSGSVQFYDAGVALGSASLSNDGSATLSISTLTSGAHAISAKYSGDSNSLASSSPPIDLNVQKISTVTNLAVDTNPLSAGATLHITATVAVGPAASAFGPLTGSVTFQDGGVILGSAALSSTGQATLSATSLVVGNHRVTAIYSGDANYVTSTSNELDEVVQQTPTAVNLSTAASTTLMGYPAYLTSQVTSSTGVPTGSVTFEDNGIVLGSVTLNQNGSGILHTTQLSVGAHAITALFNGDANYAKATSAVVQQTVTLAPTTLTLSSPSTEVNADVSAQFTAALGSPGIAPTGLVTLLDAGVVIGTQVVTGAGAYSFSTAQLGVGTHILTASYGGDTNNSSVTSTSIIVVVRKGETTATLVSSANPLTQGSALLLTSAVTSQSPALSGSVSFYDGDSLLGNVLLSANGTAALTSKNLSLGVHHLTATYSGDVNHLPSTSPTVPELIVQASGANLTSSANPSITGLNVVFTAQITGNPVPTGTVMLKDGGVSLATLSLNAVGVATFATKALSVGTHDIELEYSGDQNFSALETHLTQTVLNATTQTSIEASASPAVYSQPLSLIATVTSNGGAATGLVRFDENHKVLGTAKLDVSGKATWTTSSLLPGSHAIEAEYVGDGMANSSMSVPLDLSVKQLTDLTVTSVANPALTLTTVQLVSAITDAKAAPATGLVTFSENGIVLGTAGLDGLGRATLSLPKMTAGAHRIMATYEGDGANFPSQSPAFTQVIQLRPTSTTVSGTATDTANPQQITLITVVRGEGSIPPSGMVTFTSGDLTLGAAAVDENGVASITVIFPTKTMPVVASYAGDSSYVASRSPQTAIVAGDPAQFTLAVDTSSISLVSHNRTTIKVTIGSVKGFTDQINLGCLGLPYAATCTFDKSKVTLGADGTVTAQLILDTGNPLGAGVGTSAAVQTPNEQSRTWMCLLPAGLLIGGLARRRKRLGSLVLLMATLGLASGVMGCGGLSMTGTPAGSYTFKVIGTGQGSGTTEAQIVTLLVTQ